LQGETLDSGAIERLRAPTQTAQPTHP